MNKEMSVNEVKVGFENLIFACGDNYAKIYYYDIENDSVRELFELFDENQKFNCLDFCEIFEVDNKVFKYDAKYFKNGKNEKTNNIEYDPNILNKKYFDNENDHILDLNSLKENSSNIFLVAFSGENPVIRVFIAIQKNYKIKVGEEIQEISILDFFDHCSLISHNNEIFDLKFHPINNQILLSSAKDFSVRLWNAFKGILLLIISGPECHLAEILSIDFHLTGQYIVTGSVDTYIKIWDLHKKEIVSKINNSLNDKIPYDTTLLNRELSTIKPLIYQPIIFSSNMIHDNYVDCVKFNNNFVLSKSVDGTILEWIPFFDKGTSNFMIINSYNFKLTENIWNMKFDTSYNFEYLSIGNNIGEIFIFKLLEDIDINKDNCINKECIKRDIYRIKYSNYYNTNLKTVIRKVSMDRNNKFIVSCNDKGKLLVNQIYVIEEKDNI